MLSRIGWNSADSKIFQALVFEYDVLHPIFFGHIDGAPKNEDNNKNGDVEKLRIELDRYKHVVLQQEEHIQVNCSLCFEFVYLVVVFALILRQHHADDPDQDQQEGQLSSVDTIIKTIIRSNHCVYTILQRKKYKNIQEFENGLLT